ncbi:hypothetical protein [Rhizobium tumorigenes]|uniref:Uncharacterized protein n=1 Tax=Rhizobium tumorigenes TaxID=2041385 RepID=A0AAF1KS19_9HYPH|nr:hypothetical protein [Rhizobium tumorigenes]WFR96878.1 hypothetical protein PR017_07125 [Rhizobium tumorigenes]
MHTAKTPNCQQPLGRIIASRLFAAGARERLLEALEYLANGEVIAGKHAVEDAIDCIENGGRDDNAQAAGLAEMPPVYEIDAALHQRRRSFLASHAKRAGWLAQWSGETFLVADDATTITVHPSDVWTSSTGMPDMEVSGIGLTSLHAHLSGRDLASTVAGLADWIAKKSAMEGAR